MIIIKLKLVMFGMDAMNCSVFVSIACCLRIKALVNFVYCLVREKEVGLVH